jgi:quinoprotein glucose dehydrogenase
MMLVLPARAGRQAFSSPIKARFGYAIEVGKKFQRLSISHSRGSLLIHSAILIGIFNKTILGQGAKTAGDWPMFNRDLGATRFSPLSQIDTNNVNKLEQAWSYRLQPTGFRFATASGTSELTPIVVNGVMYLSAQTRVAALNAETGDEIWRYDVPGGQASPRGVAYWPGDRQSPPRIFFTAGRNLIALGAATGRIDPAFGNQGTVDMVVPYAGVPTIIKNVIAVGATTGEQETGPPGNTRAFDARTGKKLWEFQSVPHPGQLGSKTWLDEGWIDRSGVNDWGWYMSADESRGILYMTLGAPNANYYGGDRPGANLFANSIVAVDAATGKYKWHFQTVHHDLWDFDLPPAPALLETLQNGRNVSALVEVGKSGYMFILDRLSGKPLFPVEERPVPEGDVPAEWYSPTQPFPVKPLPLARVSMSRDDLVTGNDTTPAHAKACEELWDKVGGFYNDGPFSPFLLRPEGAPPKYSIQFPGATGGVSWGGVAVDPKSGYVFIQTHDSPLTGWVEKKREGGRYESVKLPYDRPIPGSVPGTSGFSAPIRDASGNMVNVPCFKPPWSRIVAVNALTGEIAWRTTLGINPALPEGRQTVGGAGSAGPIVTAGGLVFIGATYDARFRAFDVTSGRELWTGRLEHMANAVPITYQGKNGKQYLAVTASDTVVGFALPDEPTLLRGATQSRK